MKKRILQTFISLLWLPMHRMYRDRRLLKIQRRLLNLIGEKSSLKLGQRDSLAFQDILPVALYRQSRRQGQQLVL
jgi:hypothetical protein